MGCQCGAGMPCECVRADGLEEPDVSQVFDEKTPATKSSPSFKDTQHGQSDSDCVGDLLQCHGL